MYSRASDVSQNSEFSRSSECEFLAQISSQLNSHYEKSYPTPSYHHRPSAARRAAYAARLQVGMQLAPFCHAASLLATTRAAAPADTTASSTRRQLLPAAEPEALSILALGDSITAAHCALLLSLASTARKTGPTRHALAARAATACPSGTSWWHRGSIL
jgi:hypothetical protein